MAAIVPACELLGVVAEAEGTPTERPAAARARATISVPTVSRRLGARTLWSPALLRLYVNVFLHVQGPTPSEEITLVRSVREL
jgi:hypothetical protein